MEGVRRLTLQNGVTSREAPWLGAAGAPKLETLHRSDNRNTDASGNHAI
jgi:hypothetical protein